ncbi:MAG: putative ferric reductase [Clostridiaceae bacterium]|jgi:predicted ferric reductase|nr:putative ferric reductase [Clostridiaceae bacterium]
MRKKTGILFISFSMLVTGLFWLLMKPTRNIPMMSQYSQLLASFAMAAFAMINFISTRHRLLDYLFDGLDKSYIYHKYLSISALLLVVIHNITIGMARRIEFREGIRIPRDPYAMYGSFSLYLFVVLISIAILAKKLNYERWKSIHKFMPIPYAMGIYHYYGSANYAVFSVSAYAMWMDFLNILGVASAVYSIFLYEKTAFKYHFKIKNLQVVADDTLEITGSALGKSMKFKPGQFAFIKTAGKDNKLPSHPFTISEAPKHGEIQFTIKALGDDTRAIFNTLKIGDEFAAAGPHGKFNYETGTKNQIWIAGGIGVTPFRSFLQSVISKDYNIDFFYSYKNEKEAAYVDELKELANDENFKLHLINTKEQGRLTVNEICKYAKFEDTTDVYFCGPRPMRESLRKQFESSSLKVGQFHFEHFQFK